MGLLPSPSWHDELIATDIRLIWSGLLLHKSQDVYFFGFKNQPIFLI